MTGFRITQILFWFGLSIYFGGLLILGTLVAPEIFNTIAAAGVHTSTINPLLNESKELAGRIFGNILYYFSIFQLICLFLMLFSVLFQMAFHLNAMSIWVWLRLGGVLMLALLLGAQMLRIDPAVRREHQLWLQYVDTDAARAAVHQAQFARDHAAAERNGIIQMILLLTIVCIQGWGINYPTRREFIRALAQKAKLIEPPPAPPGKA
ncbi:MAG: hypothetical protein ACP5VQ_01005 [Phycisphaerae bacterium]